MQNYIPSFKNKNEIRKFQAQWGKKLKMLIADGLSAIEIVKDILQAEDK